MLKADSRELTLIAQLKSMRVSSPNNVARKLNVLQQITLERGDYYESQRWAQRIIDESPKKKIASIDKELQYKALGILRKAYMHRAREDFETFLHAMEWDREPTKRFYQPMQKQLRHVVKKMQELADGKWDDLVFSMPPRVGKTTLGILFNVWLAGKYPLKSILSAGYSSALANSFYDGALEFIVGEEYCFFGEIFPESYLVGTNAKNLTLDLMNARRYKSLTFRSIDGSVTGATEASVLLNLDDLVSGIEEALNPDDY